MKDPKAPDPEPESEELRALLGELHQEHAAQSDGDAPRLSADEQAALRHASASALHQALSELYDLQDDQQAPGRDPLPAAAAPPAAPAAYRESYRGELAGIAARVLVDQTARTAAEQRALGIADAALGPDDRGWLDAVAAKLAAQPPELIFAAWVKTLGYHRESPVLNRLATESLAQLPTLEPHVEALVALQRHILQHRSTTLLTVLRAAPVDAALGRLLTAMLATLGRRSAEEQWALGELAGTVAQKRRELAGTIAAAAAQKRRQPSPHSPRHLSEEQALAVAVGAAGLPELVPTATLGLMLGSGGAVKQWAQALARCDARECVRRLLAPERGLIGRSFGLTSGIDVVVAALDALPSGAATEALRRSLLNHPDPYLRLEVAYKNPDARRRIVEVCAILASLEAAPGWVALHPQRDRVLRFMKEKYTKVDWHKLASRYGRPLVPLAPPLTPLQAATSRHPDLRHRALRNLAQEGRPQHLLAALLAADLDRALEERGYAAVWRVIPWGRWPKLKFSSLDHGSTKLGLRALVALVPRLDRLRIVSPQRLSPELAELQRVGATAYADRYPPPEPLALEDQLALQAAEAAFIASAPDRPN